MLFATENPKIMNGKRFDRQISNRRKRTTRKSKTPKLSTENRFNSSYLYKFLLIFIPKSTMNFQHFFNFLENITNCLFIVIHEHENLKLSTYFKVYYLNNFCIYQRYSHQYFIPFFSYLGICVPLFHSLFVFI